MRVKPLVSLAALVVLFPATQAEAYVDPGTAGLLSQLLYLLFYGAVALFLYCFRYLKQSAADMSKTLAKLFRRRGEP